MEGYEGGDEPVEFAYIGLNSDGEVRAISMDDAGSEKENRRLVSEWLKMGRKVERVSAAEARQRMKTRAA